MSAPDFGETMAAAAKAVADHPELSREACIAAAESTRRAIKFREEEAKKLPSVKAADLRVEVRLDGVGYRLTHLPTGVVAEDQVFGVAVDKLQGLVDQLLALQAAADDEQGNVKVIKHSDADALTGLADRLVSIEARLTRLERGS